MSKSPKSISVVTYLAIDEFDVVRALGVAVTSTILGTGFIIGEPRNTAIGVHLYQVEGTVETAEKVRHVYVKGELLVLQVEHHVGAVVVEQINARTDVFVGTLGDEVQAKGVA